MSDKVKDDPREIKRKWIEGLSAEQKAARLERRRLSHLARVEKRKEQGK